jgi:tRNA (guanine-N7-)-methyltransferase
LPHILVKEFKKPTFPLEIDEIRYEQMTQLYKGVGLIKVATPKYHFFLRYVKKEDGYLIKFDKSTRIPELNIIKKAINSFATLCDMEIVQSNTAITRIDHIYANYKSLDFFLNGRDYTQKVWVEVGFGSGLHLMHNAKKHPDVLHIGIEIHKPSAEQLLKHCKLENINNIYVIDVDARTFLEILPSNSVEKLFVHFPVPWDKAEHRRVISRKFVDESSRILEVDGVLNLRTDSDNYALYSQNVFMSNKLVDLHVKKNFQIGVVSKYEARWQRQEKDIYDFTLRNHETSEAKSFDYHFDFKTPHNYTVMMQNLHEHTFVQEEYLLHIQEQFPMDKGGILKLTLGVKGAPVSLYVIFDESGEINYFPHKPLPIAANIAAHEHFLKVISDATNHPRD